MRGRLVACTVVLLVGLSLPGAGAAGDPSVLGASYSVARPLDVAALEEVVPRRAVVDDVAQSCGADHLLPLPDHASFRFTEDNLELGCAEARFVIGLPPGAAAVEVRFRADRDIDQPAVAELPVQMLQELRVYALPAGADVGAQDMDAFLVLPVFEKESGSVGPLQDKTLRITPPANATRLAFGWYFEDRGPSLGQEVPNPIFGQWFRATVSQPESVILGIPLATLDVERTRQDTTRNAVLYETRVAIEAPEPAVVGGQVALQVRTTGDLVVGDVIAPGGQPLAHGMFSHTLDDGVGTVRVEESAIRQYGAGTYTVRFQSSAALQVEPIMVPFVLGLMAAPGAFGALATREWELLRRQAVDAFAVPARSLRMALWFWWAVYAAALLVVVTTRQWPLVVAWPLQVEAALFHSVFVVIAVVFAALGIVWRRQFGRLMEQEMAEKEHANQELGRSNKDLEMFAYVASHDLQEPLRTVASYTELLRRRYRGRLDADADEFIDSAVGGAQRMQALIDDLLEYSRIGTRGKPMRAVDCDHIMVDTLDSLKAVLEQSGATVVHDGLPVVQADPTQLRQVFQNLISNAIRFRHPKRPPRVTVSAVKDGLEWHFAVRDNGIGIPADQHERIFVIFQRLHGGDEVPGTGIGLAIVKKIVERHGGRVWLESRPGQGSTFFFSLPRYAMHGESR